MADSSPSEPGPSTAQSAELLDRARAGDSHALSALFRKQRTALRRWARGRLPVWARSAHDTADLVQEALLQTLRRLDRFDDRGKGALAAYLRQAVMNRIRDEIRKVGRRPLTEADTEATNVASEMPSPFDMTLTAEQEQKYKRALGRLSDDERLLVVGRIELGYNYEQLALISKRPNAEATRQAVRRAVVKLAERMSSLNVSNS